jgi:hypothetical protein
MIIKILGKITMLLLHIMYKRIDYDILYIKGTENKYPRYLLYTEKESIYKRMEEF